MCYQNCQFENWDGECIHKPKDGPMPCEYEDDDAYEAACEDAEGMMDMAMDAKYEEMKDRRMGI